MNSLVSREKALKMVKPEYRPMPEEQIHRIKKNAEENAKKTAIEKMDLSGYSESELDNMIMSIGMNTPEVPQDMIAASAGQPAMAPMDAMAAQPAMDPAMMQQIPPQAQQLPPEQLPMDIPQTPESGGENAPVNMPEANPYG